MRLIGIPTQRRAPEGRTFLGLLEPYLEALASQGLAYALIPPQPPEALERLLPHLDGLLLPGGPDVDPAHFGEEPQP
jgi:putative glutamine amidotransferase